MTVIKIKVGYSTSIPIMAYGIKDNAWAEVEVEGNADFKEVWNELKEKVDAAVREKYPHLYTTDGKSITFTLHPEPDKINYKELEKAEMTQEEALISLIEKDCKTIPLLERQRKQVERMGSDKVREAFENRLKLLQGGNS